MEVYKIIRNDIHVGYKIIVIGVLMATNVRLIFYQIVDAQILIRFLACVLIAIVLLSLNSFVLIDFKKQKISEGYCVFSIPFITTYKGKFSGFEKMYINFVTSGWTSDSLGFTEGATPPMYKAFLKTNEGDKFCVAIGANKSSVLARVVGINSVLKTEMFDNTIG